jgi:hypothetical protein
MTTRHEDRAVESAERLADAGATVSAVDDSSRDARVLPWVAEDATTKGSELVIIKVVEEGVLVSPSCSLASGKRRADRLIDARRTAQLPVMLLSTTLSALLRFTDCPVMVIPETRKGGDGHG